MVADKKPAPNIPTALFISVIAALILGGVPFGIGKYIEFNSPGPFDSGAYVYSAQRLLDGAQYGTEELSSARPGTLIANIIGVLIAGAAVTVMSSTPWTSTLPTLKVEKGVNVAARSDGSTACQSHHPMSTTA